MTEKESKIWKEGYEAGVKMVMRSNEDSIEIGKAILEIMYKRFQTLSEED